MHCVCFCVSLLFRVLLANTNELIEMQTRNDTTDPRSSATFYERYHSLDDVGISCLQLCNTSGVSVLILSL